MKTAQLIHRTETTLYLSEMGEVLPLEGSNAKIHHILSGGETKTMKQEEIVKRIRYKNQAQLNGEFWKIMEDEKLDSRDYFLVTE